MDYIADCQYSVIISGEGEKKGVSHIWELVATLWQNYKL